MEANPFESPKAPLATPEAPAPRPKLRLGDIVRRSIAVLVQNPIPYGIIVLVNFVFGTAQRLAQGEVEPGTLSPTQWVFMLVGYPLFIWSMGVAIHAAEGLPTATTLLKPIARVPAGLLAMLLYTMAVVVGSLFLVVPGIYLGVRFAFSPPATVAGRTTFGGFGRSSELVRGRFWSIFLLLLVGMVPSLILVFLTFASVGFDPTKVAEAPFIFTIIGTVIGLWPLAYYSVLYLAAEGEDETL